MAVELSTTFINGTTASNLIDNRIQTLVNTIATILGATQNEDINTAIAEFDVSTGSFKIIRVKGDDGSIGYRLIDQANLSDGVPKEWFISVSNDGVELSSSAPWAGDTDDKVVFYQRTGGTEASPTYTPVLAITADSIIHASIGDIGNLGAGDITSIVVEDGLSGGGETGEVTIGIDSIAAGKIATVAGDVNKVLTSNGTTVGWSFVGATGIQDGGVGTVEIADGAIITDKLYLESVTAAKIAPAAVTETKIGAGAVTNTKIGSLAVTSAKISSGSATDGQVLTADGAGNTAWEAAAASGGSGDFISYLGGLPSEIIPTSYLGGYDYMSVCNPDTFNGWSQISVSMLAEYSGTSYLIGKAEFFSNITDATAYSSTDLSLTTATTSAWLTSSDINIPSNIKRVKISLRRSSSASGIYVSGINVLFRT